ncbi:hypothetical protein JB92DRAFT_3104554 [Gautieria morchelliformis]|nr:hypothetical protein JB92DRAFT_3104554 [Gautieria morchelliformis]
MPHNLLDITAAQTGGRCERPGQVVLVRSSHIEQQSLPHSARRWPAHSTTPSTTPQHTPPHTAMPLPPPFPPHVLSLPSPDYRRPSPGAGGFLGGVASTAPLRYNTIPRADVICALDASPLPSDDYGWFLPFAIAVISYNPLQQLIIRVGAGIFNHCHSVL